MVAFLRLFHHLKILIEHALLGEGDAVDAGKLLAVLVAFPVCTCYCSELHGLDIIDMLYVRAAAKVGEATVLIESDGAIFQVMDKFHFVGVSLLGEILEGVSLGNLGTLENLFGACEFNHLVLDLLEIRFAYLGVSKIHVVVEARLDCGAHAELYARIQRLQGFRHKVG